MPAAYVLRSTHGRHYYGSTTDLPRRLAEHARGKTTTTRKEGGWSLIGYAEFADLDSARAQERQFKRWRNPERVLAWLAAHGTTTP